MKSKWWSLGTVGRDVRYQIQWDSRSKRWPYRLVTLSGECIAYFRDFNDARTFCEVK